jgi:imidazolonepropionase-like amidohydrolase
MKTHSIFYFVLMLSMISLISCTKEEQKSEESNLPANEAYTVLIGGTEVGYLKVSRLADTLITDYDYKDNGRGPTIKDTIIFNEKGFPVNWKVSGNTTFGNTINEHFELKGKKANWTDATGSSEATVTQDALYIAEGGSPYMAFLGARVLLRAKDSTIKALPAGELKITAMESFKAKADTIEVNLTSYAISGSDLNPTYIILDDQQLFFALISPRFILIREGFEQEEKRMRGLAEKYGAERFQSLQTQYAHDYEGPVRIKNVRIFNPKTLSLSEPSSVVILNEKILSIEAADAETQENETVIEGDGGTLVPGLYDMHAHMGENAALLNVLAGVTSVRDMGNNNEVLDELIKKIESGVLAGPRITRLGFIEGKSPFNSNNGILVTSEEEALEAVQTYADKGFYGIKLYNSMNGDWAPNIIKKAHELDLFVTGHVPAFSNANNMIRAGYDEMTHINQVMLGWVLEAEEDTRTLLRLTALKRLPALEIQDPKIKETIELMVKNKVAMDPTLGIHEALMLGRNGEVRAGVVDYIDHMPANVQRSYKVALANVADSVEDLEYREAYDKIISTLKVMKEKNILIVPGTDLGGAFTLHRELELYQQLGYSPAELVKLGSYDMAQYLGHNDRGIIEEGKLADFFLIPGNPIEDIKAIKTISMVSRGGTIYYPTEIYPAFGIEPFTDLPVIN